MVTEAEKAKLQDLKRNFEHLCEILVDYWDSEDAEIKKSKAEHICHYFPLMMRHLLEPVHQQWRIDALDQFESEPQITRIYCYYLLLHGFPIDARTGRRLAHALAGLNFDEVEPLLRPTNKGLRKSAYTIGRLQVFAAVHVSILHGYGFQKKAARLKVAQAYGVGANDNIETIRSWEQRAIRENVGHENVRELLGLATEFGRLIAEMPIQGLVERSVFLKNYFPERLEAPVDSSEEIQLVPAWELTCSWLGDKVSEKLSEPKPLEALARDYSLLMLTSELMYMSLEDCGKMFRAARCGEHVWFPLPIEQPLFVSRL